MDCATPARQLHAAPIRDRCAVQQSCRIQNQPMICRRPRLALVIAGCCCAQIVLGQATDSTTGTNPVYTGGSGPTSSASGTGAPVLGGTAPSTGTSNTPAGPVSYTHLRAHETPEH